MNNVVIYQNTQDAHHMNKHLKLYLKERINDTVIVNDGENYTEDLLNVLYYSDPESGHSPPTKVKTIEMINLALECGKRKKYRFTKYL